MQYTKMIDLRDNLGNVILSIEPDELELKWKYFFGSSGSGNYDRYYKTEIDGQRVEKHATNRGVKYSIGNMDIAKTKYKTELELIIAVKTRK